MSPDTARRATDVATVESNARLDASPVNGSFQFGLRTLFAIAALGAIVSCAGRMDVNDFVNGSINFLFGVPQGDVFGYLTIALSMAAYVVLPASLPIVPMICFCSRSRIVFLWSFPLGVAMLMGAALFDAILLFPAGAACVFFGGLFALAECHFKGITGHPVTGAALAIASAVTGYAALMCAFAASAAC